MEPNKPSVDTSTSSTQETKPRLHKGFALFWLVPLAAVGLTAYLFYQTIQSEGTDIQITFETAKGLVPGKSEIHYHGVKVGLVKTVTLSDDFKSVVVGCQLERTANSLARADAQFWIVHPQISLSGVSGLDTLIGGNYIEVQSSGTGETQTKFTGLSHPAGRDPLSPDTYVRLVATNMPSIGVNSPVLFRQMTVGQVDDMDYDVQRHKAVIDIHIYKEYANLVRRETRFWNTSGLDVSMGLSGVTVKSPSLDSVLFGSISLGLPDSLVATSPAVPDGSEFELFDSIKDVIQHEAETINKSVTSIGLVLTLHMAESQGINPSVTELRYRGLKVGTVVSVLLSPDMNGVLVKILLDPRLKNMADANNLKLQDLARANSRFILVWPQIEVKNLSKLQVPPSLVQGPYFRVEPGDGDVCTDFKVTETQDESFRPMDGLRVVLKAGKVGKLIPGSPVYYRGVQVGQIEDSSLAADGSSVHLTAIIGSDYSALVRSNTKFWNCSGISTSLSLLGGMQVKSESVTSVLEGGVAFATPDNAQMGARVKYGTSFELADKAEDSWLNWKPSIPLNQ